MSYDVLALLNAIQAAGLPTPDHWDHATAPPTPVFVPALTTEQQTTLAQIEGLLESTVALSLTDWTKIAVLLPNIRAFRQLTRPGVMAMTQTDRDRLYFDTLSDMAHLLVILLRDASG